MVIEFTPLASVAVTFIVVLPLAVSRTPLAGELMVIVGGVVSDEHPVVETASADEEAEILPALS